MATTKFFKRIFERILETLDCKKKKRAQVYFSLILEKVINSPTHAK